MNIVEEYDVLRLIQHNQNCYVSSAKVKGCLLVQWMKYHPRISKKQIMHWMSEIVRKLEQLHKSRGNPCYQYVNPYSIIIDEEEGIHLLDVNAPSNAEQVKFMQRRVIREHFLPPDERYYQRASIELDIYGLGKTLQYFLSFIEVEPEFTKREETKIQKIISKCLNRNSKKSFQNVSEIQHYIPEYQFKEKKNWLTGKRVALCMTAAFVAGMTVHVPKEQEEKTEIVEMQEEIIAEPETEALKKELGLLYFQELKNYAKSKEYFFDISEDAVSENMAIMAECLSASVLNKTKLKKALYELETNLVEEERELYLLSLLRGYVLLDSQEAQEEILRLGEECMETQDARFVPEIQGYLAIAYEATGAYEQAVQMYEDQLEEITEQNARIEVYKKIANIWELAGANEKYQESLRLAIQEYPEEKSFRNLYIRMQLKDENADKEICMQTIETFIQEVPDLKTDEEFEKLIKEYDISLEEKE